VRSGVIGHKDPPVSQCMIFKMVYNVCVKHFVAVCNSIEVTLKTCNSNLQLKEKHPDSCTAATERWCTHQVPVMKCNVSITNIATEMVT
jgi:hypothetical protein